MHEVRGVLKTTCCVVGAGPAGAILALLLARRGISVVLLEAHGDFDRDFRGDTVHPAIMAILRSQRQAALPGAMRVLLSTPFVQQFPLRWMALGVWPCHLRLELRPAVGVSRTARGTRPWRGERMREGRLRENRAGRSAVVEAVQIVVIHGLSRILPATACARRSSTEKS